MGIGWMPQEVEVVIIHLENKGKVQLQYQSMNQLKHEPIKKVYVEMVRKVVESEERENENAE